MTAGPFELRTPAQRAEAAAVFRRAFVEVIPSRLEAGEVFTSRRFLASSIRMIYGAFGSAADARWYGVSEGGPLVSTALVTNAAAGLTWRSYLALLRFGVEFVLMLGWGGMRQLLREVKTWPPGQGRSVAAAFSPRPRFQELQLIATCPKMQGRGHGEVLLAFLKADAAARGYLGLSLTAMGKTPAHGWYLRHGFVSEVEFEILDVVVCRMTLGLNPGNPGAEVPPPAHPEG